MLSLETIEDTVQAWAVAASGLDDAHVIFSHQDGPDPSGGPFITINVMEDSDTLGMYPEQKINGSGVPYTIEHWRLDGMIEAFGPGARQVLLNLKSKGYLESFYNLLLAQGIDLDFDKVTSMPNTKNRSWEEHAQLPIIIRVGDSTTTDTGLDGETPPPYATQLTYTGPDVEPHPIASTTVTAPTP